MLSLISTAIGGYFYYSASKDYAYRDAYKRADSTVKIAVARITSKITEHQKAVRTLAGLKEIRKISLGTKAVFISGYTSDIIRSRKIIEEDLTFVSKPVYPDILLTKIREMLQEYKRRR